jgi:Zn-dependent protease
MNLSVGLFNLLPIPPLDGYHIFNDILLKGRLRLNRDVFQIAQVVLIVLCLTGGLSRILNTAFDTVEESVLRLLLRIAGLY